MEDYNDFYKAAQGLMYNPVVNGAFGFTAADSARYGSTALGNACLVAAQVLKANQGTRFIQITSNDGWDMHQNIYAAGNLPGAGQDPGQRRFGAAERSEGQRPAVEHAGRDVRRVRAHGGPAHGRRRAATTGRSMFAVFRRRRRARAARAIGATNATRVDDGGLRLVAEPLRLSGGYRGDDLLGAGDRLDDGSPRRSAGPRLRVRPADRPLSVLPGS